MDLIDEQWNILKPLIPQPSQRRDRCGRPRRNERVPLNDILWIMRIGAKWKEIPSNNHQTFPEIGSHVGAFEAILKAPVRGRKEQDKLDLSKWFIAGTIVTPSLATLFNPELAKRLLGDDADDRAPLGQKLAENGVGWITSPRCKLKQEKTQEGRKLCCSRKLLKGERWFANLQIS